MASIAVTPENPLVDELVNISISGLRPGQPITLVARVDENGARFISHAHYIADGTGHVTTADMTSVGGSYSGLDQMGLFTTLLPEANQKPGRRLMKSDVTTPLDAEVSVYEGHFEGSNLGELGSRRPLASKTAHRWYKAQGITRVEVRDGRLKGTFFIPEGAGPFPGVVDMFGTVGGTVEHRSALLASRGIASLALCYFTPDNGVIQDIEYFESAAEWVYSQPCVIKTGVGVVGVSKGFEMALLTAVVCPKVKAVVAISGVHYNNLVPHTYKDEVFPCVDTMTPEVFVERNDDFVHIQDTYNNIPAAEKQDAAIPVERSEAHFLVILGADDQCAPLPHEAGDGIAERLARVGRRNHCKCVIYPETGHLIEPPYSPLCDKSYHGFFSKLIMWGGKPREHAYAQLDSWNRIQKFIVQNLQPRVDGKLGENTVKASL